MAFKKCTVASAKVAATLSSYPTYVDLARAGVTTLAEAQSIRVYADESKTTEWARDIVSVTEMHVKIPSLTTTTTIYVDYDGVRSDYAVTDTYGRNAVWSDYFGVFHAQQASGDLINSTGGSVIPTVGSPTYSAAGKISNAITYGGTDSFVTASSIGSYASFSLTSWLRPTNTTGGFEGYAGADQQFGVRHWQLTRSSTNTIRFLWFLTSGNATLFTTSALSANSWHYVAATHTGSLASIYYNGASEGTLSSTLPSRSPRLGIGDGEVNTSAVGWIGQIDETRLRLDALSANWITTEYNNQSDESGFWPTWEDVGGGAVAKKGFLAWL